MGIAYITKEFANFELQNKELYEIDIIENFSARQLRYSNYKIYY